MCDEICSYVAKMNEPETWHGKDPMGWRLNVESDLGGLGVDEWRCPHQSIDGRDYCIFHTPPDQLSDEADESEALLDALNRAGESPFEDGPEHKAQFVGAIFGALNISNEIITANEHDVRFDHSTIRGYGENIRFENTRFVTQKSGTLSFQSVSVVTNNQGELTFDGTKFTTKGDGAVNFTGSEFITEGRGDVSFANAEFTTKGEGDVSFADVEFITKGEGDVNFAGAEFSTEDKGRVWFRKAKFTTENDGEVSFYNSNFVTKSEKKVSFEMSTFITKGEGGVWFGNTKFATENEGDIWFEGANFITKGEGGVSFQSAKFITKHEGNVWFYSAKFISEGSYDVSFRNATFITKNKGNVAFDETEFTTKAKGYVSFDQTDFTTMSEGHVSFYKSEFTAEAAGKVYFGRAEFTTEAKGNVLFSEANFTIKGGEVIWFSKAKFTAKSEGNVWFNDAEFTTEGDGTVWFGEAIFTAVGEGDICFSNVEFSNIDDGSINFNQAKFNELDIYASLSYDHVTYRCNYNQTVYRNGTGSIAFDHAIFESDNKLDFSKISVKDDLCFSGVVFECPVKFTDRLTDPNVTLIFSEAEFADSCQFGSGIGSTKSREHLDFSDAIFKAQVDFKGETPTAASPKSNSPYCSNKYNVIFSGSLSFRNVPFPDGTDFSNMKFPKDVDFAGANLTGVNFSRSNLSGANLERAQINRAELLGTNLIGAKIYGVLLGDARINHQTTFWPTADISIWNVVPFTKKPAPGGRFSQWKAWLRQGSIPYCRYDPRYDTIDGDFPGIKKSSPSGRISRLKTWLQRSIPNFRDDTTDGDLQRNQQGGDVEEVDEQFQLEKAAEVYGTLETAARDNSLPRLASEAFVGRKDVQRKQYFRDDTHGRQWLMYIRSFVPNLIARYGESPWRVLGYGMLTVTVWGLLYWAFDLVETQDSGTPATLLESVYFSSLTFTALGYGDFTPANTAGRFLAVSETAIGVIMLAILVFVFGRRATR